MTAIPYIILALLGDPDPTQVQTQIDPTQNTICYSAPHRAVCYRYIDDGTHLRIVLNEEF